MWFQCVLPSTALFPELVMSPPSPCWLLASITCEEFHTRTAHCMKNGLPSFALNPSPASFGVSSTKLCLGWGVGTGNEEAFLKLHFHLENFFLQRQFQWKILSPKLRWNEMLWGCFLHSALLSSLLLSLTRLLSYNCISLATAVCFFWRLVWCFSEYLRNNWKSSNPLHMGIISPVGQIS